VKAIAVSVRLQIYLCVLIYTNKLSSAIAEETVAELTLNLAQHFIFYYFFCFTFSFSMDFTPIYHYAKPMSASLGPLKSVEPILIFGYELHQCLVKLIRDQSFSKEGDENPYSHLLEFAQTCACLRIASMSDNTLRWKLFLFSLTGRAKHWYGQTVGSMQGDWETLCSKFYLRFFSISKVVSL
jgi:hypothetical protein